MDCFISHFRCILHFLVKTSETDTEYEIYAELPGLIKSKLELMFLIDPSPLPFKHLKMLQKKMINAKPLKGNKRFKDQAKLFLFHPLLMRN